MMMKPKMEGRRRRRCYWAGRAAAAAALSFLPFLLAMRLQCTTLLGNSSEQQYIVYLNISMFLRCVCVSMCVGWDDALDTGGQAIRLFVSMCVCVQSGSSGGSSS